VWSSALLGTVVGLLVGVGLFLLVDPRLESAGGALEDLQGLALNVVPGCALLGLLVGARLAGRRRAGRDARSKDT
jgi:hypothetical protein